MKKFLLINIIAVFFSCTNEVKEELNAVNNEATFQKNVENFMEFTQLFGKEDIEGVMDMFEKYLESFEDLSDQKKIDLIEFGKEIITEYESENE